MTPDDRELIQRLFALATGTASNASEIAVEGQNRKNAPERNTALAARLEAAAGDVLILAKAIALCARRNYSS
jgi:hypothetical protein